MIQMRFTPDSAAEFGLPKSVPVTAALRYTHICGERESKYDGKAAKFFVDTSEGPKVVHTGNGKPYIMDLGQSEFQMRAEINSGIVIESPCGCIIQYLSGKEVMEFLEYPIDIQRYVLDPEATLENLLDKLLQPLDD